VNFAKIDKHLQARDITLRYFPNVNCLAANSMFNSVV